MPDVPSFDTIRKALAAARETRGLEVGAGALALVPKVFRDQFGSDAVAAIVADTNTFEAAGRAVQVALDAAGQATLKPFIFTDPQLYAEHGYVEPLQSWLAG